MELPSAAVHRGHVPWQKLLLAVSLSAIWMSCTTAQMTIDIIPPNPIEGMDVLLVPYTSKDVSFHYWYVGENFTSRNQIHFYSIYKQKGFPGPAHNDRHTVYSNGTMLIHNINRRDTGYYTYHIVTKFNEAEDVTKWLQVFYGPERPTIFPANYYYHQGTQLRLSCYAASNPPAKYFWYLNRRFLQSTEEFVVPHITRNNTGFYRCLAYNSVTGLRRSTVKNIAVLKAVRCPSITASNTTVSENGTVVFTCHTKESGISLWWFHNNNRLQLTERIKSSWEHNTLTIHPVRREDAGNYQCMVSNPVSSSKSTPLKLNVN